MRSPLRASTFLGARLVWRSPWPSCTGKGPSDPRGIRCALQVQQASSTRSPALRHQRQMYTERLPLSPPPCARHRPGIARRAQSVVCCTEGTSSAVQVNFSSNAPASPSEQRSTLPCFSFNARFRELRFGAIFVFFSSRDRNFASRCFSTFFAIFSGLRPT